MGKAKDVIMLRAFANQDTITISYDEFEKFAKEYSNEIVIEELEKLKAYKIKLEQMFDSPSRIALATVEELDKRIKELKQIR